MTKQHGKTAELSNLVEAWGIHNAVIEVPIREGWPKEAVDDSVLAWCVDNYAFPFLGLPPCPPQKTSE